MSKHAQPRTRTAIVCGPYDCPNDPEFEHDNYFGCVPKDFKQRTGRSKTHSQTLDAESGRYVWDGGCNRFAVGSAALKDRNSDE